MGLDLKINVNYVNRQNDEIVLKSILNGYATDQNGEIYNEQGECISKILMFGFENLYDILKEK